MPHRLIKYSSHSYKTGLLSSLQKGETEAHNITGHNGVRVTGHTENFRAHDFLIWAHFPQTLICSYLENYPLACPCLCGMSISFEQV